MNGNYIAAWIVSAVTLAVVVVVVRALFRRREWKGDGTWLMVSIVVLAGGFTVVGSFATAAVQVREHECREAGGRFVRYLGCVDPATNAPLRVEVVR